jgi:membrane protease YdiL (CAAX protease family)
MTAARRSRGSVAAFFLLALLLSWAAWIPYAAASAGRIALRVPAELIWLSEYGPSVAAILVTAVTQGRAGVGRLLVPLGRWRVPPRWYAVAILTTPLVALAALGIDAAMGGASPDWSRLTGWDQRFLERTRGFAPSAGLIDGLVGFMSTGPLATGLVLVALAITNGGLSEEVGWRGFALPRLAGRLGPVLGSVAVGVLWGLWHTGTAFWQAVLTKGAAEGFRFAAGYIGRYLLLVVPLSVLYTWLWRGSGKSLFLIVLLHAAYNITVTLATSAWPAFPFRTMVVLLWVVAAGLAVRLVRDAATREPREAS